MALIKPTDYELIFEPNLETFKFQGKEKVQLEIRQSTDEIVLNVVELKITDCHLISNGEILKPVINIDNKKETLILKLPKKIGGKVELFIDFEGSLRDNLVGFYRSKYQVGGKDKYLITTQFEATDARRAFPCWDHPEYKATFDVSLVIDKTLTAISNMPISKEESIAGNKKTVKFSKTPIMSTYLLYIGIGEFEFLEDKLDDVIIRIVTTQNKKNQGKLALEYAKKFLKFYQDYFKIKYPLPKLDLIAIPDFASGAMENWGAITFREIELLYDPETSSTRIKQRIAEIIAHEISHQWFGNLVTMKWWDDLWLNESFATFMTTKAVDSFYPEWDLWSQFLNDETEAALEFDSLKTSHPIKVKVKTSSEISEIFDAISYNKGGSILKMLEAHLGERTFREGLKHYLSTYEYGNATIENLWSSLEKISKKPVKKIMDFWIKQTGYPIIEADIKDSKLVLSQKRFLLEQTKADKTVWPIPLSIKLEKNVISKMMTRKSENIDAGNSKWFKINFGQNGFYRVMYPKQLLDKLKDLVVNKKLPNVDRWGIQNDLFSLVVRGENSLSEYLDFIEAYSNEDDYLVLSDIEKNLYLIYLITSKENLWSKITEYNREFLRKVFNRLGWQPKKDEKHTDTLLRVQTINYLGRMNDKEILKESQEKFQEFLKKPASLHPDIRSGVYNSVAWIGNEDTRNILIDLYRKTISQEEKRRLLSSLSSFRDPKLLDKTLQFSLSSDVRYQDLFIPIAGVASNPYGQELVWHWVKRNWTELKKRLGSTKWLLGRMVEIMNILSDIKVANDIKRFFEENPEPKVKMTVSQTLERIRINYKFLERMRHHSQRTIY